MIKEHDPKHRCAHGFLLWWNYGDGKPRHLHDVWGPRAQICTNPNE